MAQDTSAGAMKYIQQVLAEEFPFVKSTARVQYFISIPYMQHVGRKPLQLFRAYVPELAQARWLTAAVLKVLSVLDPGQFKMTKVWYLQL
jgi:hypothetical protein